MLELFLALNILLFPAVGIYFAAALRKSESTKVHSQFVWYLIIGTIFCGGFHIFNQFRPRDYQFIPEIVLFAFAVCIIELFYAIILCQTPVVFSKIKKIKRRCQKWELYKERQQSVKIARKQIAAESKKADEIISKLTAYRAQNIDPIRTKRVKAVCELLKKASDSRDADICMEAVETKETVLKEISVLENTLQEMAVKHLEIGDYEKSVYYLDMVSPTTTDVSREELKKTIEARREEECAIVAAHTAKKRKITVAVAVTISLLLIIEGRNVYYYHQAGVALSTGNYGTTIRYAEHMWGPFPGKIPLKNTAAAQVGWICFRTDRSEHSGTLYIASADGLYHKPIGNKVEDEFAYKDGFLYYFSEGRSAGYSSETELNVFNFYTGEAENIATMDGGNSSEFYISKDGDGEVLYASDSFDSSTYDVNSGGKPCWINSQFMYEINGERADGCTIVRRDTQMGGPYPEAKNYGIGEPELLQVGDWTIQFTDDRLEFINDISGEKNYIELEDSPLLLCSFQYPED